VLGNLYDLLESSTASSNTQADSKITTSDKTLYAQPNYVLSNGKVTKDIYCSCC